VESRATLCFLRSHSNQTVPYSISHRRWLTGRCPLKVNGFDIPAEWVPVIKEAMETWNDTGADFRFVEDANSPSSVVCEELGDNGWVGMTPLRPYYNDANIAQVLIRLNTRKAFDPPHPTSTPADVGEAYDLFSVLLHELRHALHLGEDYSQDSDTVMRPTIRPGETRTLAMDDIAGINILYPK